MDHLRPLRHPIKHAQTGLNDEAIGLANACEEIFCRRAVAAKAPAQNAVRKPIRDVELTIHRIRCKAIGTLQAR